MKVEMVCKYVIEFFDMSNKIRVKSGSRQPQAWLVNHGGAAKAGGCFPVV